MKEERVQKLMAQANIASRRASEKIIEAGRVTVNGKTITIGDKADPEKDDIRVDGKRIEIETENIYVAIHKPTNVISTNDNKDDERPNIREILPLEGHLFPVGRLDAESTGLIIMTNDGELANRLTHPRYRHTKTYRVIVHGSPPPDVIEQWENGIYLEEGKTAPCVVKVIHNNYDYTTLEVIMTEGKNRQIRRVAGILGYPVHKLIRTAIGQFELGKLKENQYKILTEKDVKLLKTPAEELREIPGYQHKKRPFQGPDKKKTT